VIENLVPIENTIDVVESQYSFVGDEFLAFYSNPTLMRAE
jgi:hypothetical protein